MKVDTITVLLTINVNNLLSPDTSPLRFDHGVSAVSYVNVSTFHSSYLFFFFFTTFLFYVLVVSFMFTIFPVYDEPKPPSSNRFPTVSFTVLYI